MRGTLGFIHGSVRDTGIIPAYAGNTCPSATIMPFCRDHPRVCGEHGLGANHPVTRPGSSPRMRGTPTGSCRAAGPRRDHPRVCGEHADCIVSCAADLGSSPRMRGTLDGRRLFRVRDGIIPAYAGNTCRIRSPPPHQRDHPRVCGEHTAGAADLVIFAGSSPRMRGTRFRRSLRRGPAGIIPAYAGNTSLRLSTRH